MVTPPKRKGLSVAQQAISLWTNFPHVPRPVVRGKHLSWATRLQPTPLSITYTIRIEYSFGCRPKVQVVDPVLTPPDDERLPHVFHGADLCLYYDEFNCWHDSIASKMMPWVSEWLYYYELWVTTESWLGPENHLDPQRAKTR